MPTQQFYNPDGDLHRASGGFYDVMNLGETPAVFKGEGDAEKQFFNIDDPDWAIEKGAAQKTWGTDGINLNLPALVEGPMTCDQKCDDDEKKRKLKCDVFRKRVAEAMKRAGCPSKITGYKKAPKCGSKKTSKKAAAKKSTKRKK